MNKPVQILILILIILTPIFLYKGLNSKKTKNRGNLIQLLNNSSTSSKPKVAFVFLGLGDQKDILNDIISLKIPLTIGIIPGLKYAKELAYHSHYCGFTVILSLNLYEQNSVQKYPFRDGLLDINTTQKEIKSNLNAYWDYIRFNWGFIIPVKYTLTPIEEEKMRLIFNNIHNKPCLILNDNLNTINPLMNLAQMNKVKYLTSNYQIKAEDDFKTIINLLVNIIKKHTNNDKIIITVEYRQKVSANLKQILFSFKDKLELITIKDILP